MTDPNPVAPEPSQPLPAAPADLVPPPAPAVPIPVTPPAPAPVAAPVAPVPPAAPPVAAPAPVAEVGEVVPVVQPLPSTDVAVATPAPAPLAVRNLGEVEGFTADEVLEMAQLAAAATEVVDTNDLRMSQLSVVQGMSRAVKEFSILPGKIVHTLTGEQFDEIEFVVAFIKKTRTRFSKEIGSPPLCSSPNALDGYGTPADQLVAAGAVGPLGGGACSRCPAGVVNFSKKIIGDCALQYNFIGFRVGEGIDASQEIPVVIQMQRTNVQAAQNLTTLLASLQFPWAGRIKLTVKEKKNDKGEYFVWQVAKAGPTTPEEQRKAFEVAKMVKNADNLVVEDDTLGSNGMVEVDLSAKAAPVGGGSAPDDDDIPF